MELLHVPDDVAVLTLGSIKLVVYLDPWGSSRAVWYVVESGEMIGFQIVGST